MYKYNTIDTGAGTILEVANWSEYHSDKLLLYVLTTLTLRENTHQTARLC